MVAAGAVVALERLYLCCRCCPLSLALQLLACLRLYCLVETLRVLAVMPVDLLPVVFDHPGQRVRFRHTGKEHRALVGGS